jgi:hypothetical protein
VSKGSSTGVRFDGGDFDGALFSGMVSFVGAEFSGGVIEALTVADTAVHTPVTSRVLPPGGMRC